jgi:peptidoglycan/xylan/chitin deacetylase (PgdA/CDA1 family)
MALVLALAVWGAGDGFLLPGQRVVPVLTYHRVTQPLRRRYPVPVTSPSDFAWQMAWLATHGYRTIDPERLTGARGAWPPKPMVITFDDGWRDNLGAARVMRRHGYTGVVFVVSGDLGRSLTLRPADLGTLERLGLRVGSHTVTHPHLDRLDEAARRRELLTSRLALERLLGHPVDLFASPYGSADLTPDLAALARRTGYRLAFASHNFGLNASAPSPYAVRRVLIPSNRLLARLEFLALLW